MPHYFLNSLIITVPAIVITLILASFVAFVRVAVQLPVQHRAADAVHGRQPAAAAGHHHAAVPACYLEIPLPSFMSESGCCTTPIWGIIVIHVAFQLGFCVFVLSNYMKTIPMELTEAAMVDGASVWRQYWRHHPAAVPAAAGRAGDAAVHLDLQRLLLGASC